MLWNSFDKDRDHLNNQYKKPNWNINSGLSLEELQCSADEIVQRMQDQPKSLIKAKVFEFLLLNGQIEVDPKEWFADKLNHGEFIHKLRSRWWNEINQTVMKDFREKERAAWAMGAYRGEADFGHTTPDWNDVLSLGLPGLLKRIKDCRQRKIENNELTDEQKIFYDSAEIVYSAVIKFIMRLSEEASRYAHLSERMKRSAECLEAIATRPPRTLYEAMQLAYIFHRLQEMEGERVRSLGGIDRLYYPFYRNDIDNGLYTREQEKELIKYFLNKFYAADIAFNQPLYLGGIGVDGKDAVTELSYLILEAYDEIEVTNPKIHIRVYRNTPDEFLKQALGYIREGNSSIVFINDEVAIKSLTQLYATEVEARDYVPIGCYEPSIMGREIPCTGTASVNIAKAVELAINNGVDPLTGKQLGIETGDISKFTTFDSFYEAFKKQLKFMADSATSTVVEYEKYYMEINPAPLFSATMAECVESGKDAYAAGAKYNNGSVNCGCIASAVDSLTAIRKMIFEDKIITMEELANTLKNNWQDNEILRRKILNSKDKYGNNKAEPDRLAREISDFLADCINGKPNGRGGIFKAGLFSIDHNHYWGSKMGATPDGRKAREPLSKNLCAVTAMDKEGLTALINSVTTMDHSKFPNGSVLDIILHPSAVQGEDGLNSMLGLIKTYFNKGGFAIHGNVFDANILKEAQKNPEKYATLQVRVCGWNVYFVNLSKEEQDEFIKQAENVSA